MSEPETTNPGWTRDQSIRAWALKKALQRGDGCRDVLAVAEEYYLWVRDGRTAPAAAGATGAPGDA